MAEPVAVQTGLAIALSREKAHQGVLPGQRRLPPRRRPKRPATRTTRWRQVVWVRDRPVVRSPGNLRSASRFLLCTWGVRSLRWGVEARSLRWHLLRRPAPESTKGEGLF